MKKTKAKIKKVIKGLKKASKLHAGQAKILKRHDIRRKQDTMPARNKKNFRPT